MEVVVPTLAILIASFGYLNLGLLRTGLVGTLALAVWIGLLENLRLGREIGLDRRRLMPVIAVWAFYATFMLLAILVNSPTVKEDILVYLPGHLLFLYFVTAPRVRSDWIIGGMVLLGVSQGALALMQYFATPVFDGVFARFLGEASASNYHFVIGRLTGIWKDSVRMGVLLAVSYPFVLLWTRRKPSFVRYAAVTFIVVVALVTFTRVALLSLIVSTVLLFWNTRRVILTRALPALLTLVVLVIVLQALPLGRQFERLYSPVSYSSEYATDLESYNRGRVLEALLPHVFDHPLFGIGVSYRTFLSGGFSSAHNSLMQSALLFGIPATVALLLILVRILDGIRRVLRRPHADFALAALLSALAVAIGGTTHGVAFDAPLNMMFLMMAGIGLGQAVTVLSDVQVSEGPS